MKVANTYREAYGILQETQPQPFSDIRTTVFVRIGIDIGKQFGVRVIMWISHDMAYKLLRELEARDLPLPQFIFTGTAIYIGADPT